MNLLFLNSSKLSVLFYFYSTQANKLYTKQTLSNTQNSPNQHMGNQLCNKESSQPDYIRNQYKLLKIPPMQQKQNLITITQENQPLKKTKTLPSILQQPSSRLTKSITLIYKGHLIQCNKQSLKNLSSPIINGIVKIYKSQQPIQILYEGQMKNSRFDGYGKLYHQTQKQLLYEGEFKNGMFDGWGVTREYVGEWREGNYDGYGIYQQFSQHSNDIVTFYYEGYFQNGLYSGSGVLIKDIQWPVKQIEKIHQQKNIIDFLNEQIEHGITIFKKYNAQEIYLGQFSNGFKHGFGRLFTEKMEFSGQFSHNLYHGIGTIFNNTTEGKKVIQAVFKMGKEYKQ